MANFVIISGAPGAGKTTLANLLSERLGLPLFSKDTFKCLLADNITGEGLDYSRVLGKTSVVLLKSVLEELVKGQGTYIIESAFMKKFEEEFLEILRISQGRVVQIHCCIEGSLAKERIEKRLDSGQRHSCHQDHLRLNEIENVIGSGVYDSLNIDNTINIEMNDKFEVDSLISKMGF